MIYDAVKNDHGLRHDPFKALVAPRPIGWISTQATDGALNLAPYSFFNGVSENPHIVMFSSVEMKDSAANAAETGEFVCNLATWTLREQMNATSAPLKRGESEFARAGLTPEPSRYVTPPRVKESPAALECKLLQVIQPKDLAGNTVNRYMIMGQVVGIYIDDAVIHDGMIDDAEIKPIARLGYRDYSVVDELFQMVRPSS